MDAYLVSTLLVALAEMGDRTQLLAIMLASRYRQALPILLGILVATLANHYLAALASIYLSVECSRPPGSSTRSRRRSSPWRCGR